MRACAEPSPGRPETWMLGSLLLLMLLFWLGLAFGVAYFLVAPLIVRETHTQDGIAIAEVVNVLREGGPVEVRPKVVLAG